MKKLPVLALACVLLFSVSSLALAEGFALYEWSARGVALGGATMARTPDPSVLASNPAAITRLSGAQVQAGITGVAPYGKYTVSGSSGYAAYRGETYEVKDKIWTIPNVYYTQQVTDKLWLGVGEFSRFGLGFKYDDDWAGRYNIYDVSVVTGSVNPNVAYKLTDKLSVAVGLEVMYVDITLKKKVDGTGGMLPGAYDIDFDTSTKNWEWAWNVALHLQINDQWAVGAAYRSRLKHDIDGKLKVDKPIPMYGVPDKDFTATVYMPDSASFGVSYSPTPRLSIEAGAIFTHWSKFTDLDFDFDDPYLNTVENKKYWRNAWRLNIGVEYALNDWIDLRAGYVWDECPVNEDYEDYLIPTNDRNIYSLGVGFKPRSWTIDLAYAFVKPKDRVYSNDKPSSTGGNGTVKGRVHDTGSHVVSLSVGYKF